VDQTVPKSQEMLRPRSGVVAREINDTAVLVHLETNLIYELNATGARVWALLQEGHDRSTICERLGTEFGAPAGEIEEAVDALLADLTREGLIGA